MRMRLVHQCSCTVAVSLLAASCSLFTDVPDLTSGSSDEGADAGPRCAPHMFTYDPKGRALSSVLVSGSFNGWPQTAAAGGYPLAKDGATWTLTHALPKGRSTYKLVLNESEWIADPSNPNVTPDGYGHQNSVIDEACGD